MNCIAGIGLICVAILAVVVYCAIIQAARADEQNRQQLQCDPGCGGDGEGEGH